MAHDMGTAASLSTPLTASLLQHVARRPAHFLAKFAGEPLCEDKLKMTDPASLSEDEPCKPAVSDAPAALMNPSTCTTLPREVGGREGPDPTRFGDWEMRGRCIDF